LRRPGLSPGWNRCERLCDPRRLVVPESHLVVAALFQGGLDRRSAAGHRCHFRGHQRGVLAPMKTAALVRSSLPLLAISLAAVSVPAQAVRSGGDNARAMQQLQQLASERTSLQADNAKLKDEVADL